MDLNTFLHEYIEFLENKLIFAGYEIRDLKLEFFLKLTDKFND